MLVDRGVGQDVPAGAWDAIFYQATHDAAGLDIGFAPTWPTLPGVRGAYHFARPGESPGAAQAKLFCDRVLALGWRAKSDLWMLDIEVDGLSGAPLEAWIIAFMEYAKAKLGDRGFLYIGFPFYVTHVSHVDFTLLQRYRWWLPDYSVNDGSLHAIQGGEPFLPVLHQFTSNPFDKSVIVDTAAWVALFTAPVPAPKPTPPTYTTTDHGDAPVKTTDITGIHLDENGDANVPAPANGVITDLLVIGGSDPNTVHRNDARPTATLTQDEKFIVLVGGVPGGTYTVRVSRV